MNHISRVYDFSLLLNEMNVSSENCFDQHNVSTLINNTIFIQFIWVREKLKPHLIYKSNLKNAQGKM